MILIFIRYSDVNIPPRLSWDMKERLSSANRLAKPAPMQTPHKPYSHDYPFLITIEVAHPFLIRQPIRRGRRSRKALRLWLFSPQPVSASKALKASIQASSSLALKPKPLLSQAP